VSAIGETEWLIGCLARASAFPPPCDSVEIRQTHVSIVALAGPVVYKIRKPVDLGFLDFSNLEKRRLDCLEEVRLNRRLARNVYIGVVPITRFAEGIRVEGEGEPIEWAVKMRRLPDDASLLALLDRGKLTASLLGSVAERIAGFHEQARCSGDGGFDTVASNARENFEQTALDVGTTVTEGVFAAVRALTEQCLMRLRPLIEARARRGVWCDGHGDLRLEHVYSFPHALPPDDIVVIDCVEFSQRFRHGDPVLDIAFLVMELLFRGRDDLARDFADAYFRASGDEEGRELLAFYIAYRSVVRAKVRGIELREREISAARRSSSLAKARAHFLLALRVLEAPAHRPALILIGGLPGTGKSTLARDVAERAEFEVIRSDAVRKELAGLAPGTSAAGDWGAGIYTLEWTERTYDECLQRAENALLEGNRVIVDASFASESLRTRFIDAGRGLSVPVIWFVCQATPQTVRERLAQRRGDVSDADFAIYERARLSWEPAGPTSAAVRIEIDTERSAADALARAMSALSESGLCAS
jgi:aminoglycoside phosphotransferase family enzyme/predicted kinase